jgi:hypothetical protein
MRRFREWFLKQAYMVGGKPHDPCHAADPSKTSGFAPVDITFAQGRAGAFNTERRNLASSRRPSERRKFLLTCGRPSCGDR